MKYRLANSIFTQEITEIVSSEIKKQKISLSKLTRNHWHQISDVKKSIEKDGFPKNLVCKKLSNDLGYGIFLHPDAQPLEKGQVIAPYAGELSFEEQNNPDDSDYAFALIDDIHLTKDAQMLVNKKNKYHPRRLYCLKLDASKNGNFTRFINHSDEPNVIARLVKIEDNPHGIPSSPIEVIYFAKKTILPGEQLLVNYEDGDDSYWDKDMKPFTMTPKTYKLSSSLELIS